MITPVLVSVRLSVVYQWQMSDRFARHYFWPAYYPGSFILPSRNLPSHSNSEYIYSRRGHLWLYYINHVGLGLLARGRQN